MPDRNEINCYLHGETTLYIKEQIKENEIE